ncbi:MAG: glycosyl transferase [Phycisphaerae bacterium]|nr:glycosyl transferase [Phycisphaerae bacterium]MBM90963.1 glycosyl transferase [Phycisphaerae bacterium]
MIDTQTQPDSTPRPLRVALAHDWLVGYRGGEMVLDAIASLLQRHNHTITRIYTMFDNASPLSPTLDPLPRTVSSLNARPESLRRWLLPRYPKAVEELSARLRRDHASEPIDLLISTSSAAIKSIQPPPGVPHICYCHAPARYLWSQTDNYASPDLKGRLRALGLALFAPRLRAWDQATAGRVDHYIANSTHTANEIRRCYRHDAAVIHPPVRTDFFTPDPATPRGDHLLLVAALEPYKRVDLAIDAALRLNRKLMIVGSGSHEASLRNHAKNNPLISFVGKVSDEQLRDHYRRASAFLFPQIEDFGITAVEAQACGTPVVAQHAGGALDSVIGSSTGSFFQAPTPESLAEAIKQCPTPDSSDHGACRSSALRFTSETFARLMNEAIAQTVNQANR